MVRTGVRDGALLVLRAGALLLLGEMAWGQTVSAPVIESAPAQVATGQAGGTVASLVTLEVQSPLAIFYGERVDGVAQVLAGDDSAMAGTVSFLDGGAVLCTLSVQDGASCPESVGAGMGAGTHVLTVAYSGDGGHGAAGSNAVTVTVRQDGTSTALASSSNPVAAGGSVVFTAVVQGEHGPAAGTVSFMDGAAVMGTATVGGSGSATLAVLLMTPGTHAIVADYAGSANSAASSSEVLRQVVTAPLAVSTTTLAASPAELTAGQPVGLRAVVSAGGHVATGTVSFVDGGTVLGSAVLDATGTAAWTASALGVGEHSIVARYAGDDDAAPSLSAAVVVKVLGAVDTVVGLGLNSVTVNAGQAAVIPVIRTAGLALAAEATSVSCTGLPDEASCSYVAGTVRIQTAGPRDCGVSSPYGVAELPLAGPMLAGGILLLLPRRRWRSARPYRRLLLAVVAAALLSPLGGCGTGNCTDLGTRPGSYAVMVSVTGMAAPQKVMLVVKP